MTSTLAWRPRVAIVIVTYNSAEDIRACLSSVTAGTRTLDFVIIVVDNCSTDNTVAVVKDIAAQDGRMLVHENTANNGFAAACNQGVEVVPSDYVILLNPDTVTHDGALDALVAFVARNEGAGPVGGRTVDSEGRVDPRAIQRTPSLSRLLLWATGLSAVIRRLPGVRSAGWDPEVMDPARLVNGQTVEVIVGCLLCMRTSDWRLLGGFDESFWLYYEDVDLSVRARRAGLRPTYTSEATVQHHWGRSSASPGKKTIALLTGQATFRLHHWHGLKAMVASALVLVGVALRTLAARALGRSGTWPEVWAARAAWMSGWPQRL